MKKTFLALFLFIMALIAQAQTSQKIVIKVEHGHHVVNALSKNGQFVIIALDTKEIQSAWEKKLKGWGKVEENKGTYTVHGAIIPEISKNPVTIYSHVSSSTTGTKVWWGIDLGSAMVTPQSHAAEYSKMEKILHDFAAEQYIADINIQIAAAEKVVQNATRAQQKVILKGEQITQSIENNKKEKLELEQKLEQNRLDAIQLQKDLEQNKLDQQNAAAEVVKMQKALEVVKAKLNTVQ